MLRGFPKLKTTERLRRKRDALLLLLVLVVAAVGFWTALHQQFNRNRPDWIGLNGTVVDKRLSFHEHYVKGSSVQAYVTIRTDRGDKVETLVPLSIYGDTKVGDRVEGSRDSLNIRPRMSDP